MGAGEDRCGGLPLELLDGDQRVLTSPQPGRALLDESPHQRPVLVQRRPSGVLVLDKGDRKLRPLLDLTQEIRERPEREAAECEPELRCANSHDSGYAPNTATPVEPAHKDVRLDPVWLARRPAPAPCRRGVSARSACRRRAGADRSRGACPGSPPTGVE